MKNKCPRVVVAKESGEREILALSCEKSQCKKAKLQDVFVEDCLKDTIKECYEFNTKKREKELNKRERC